MKLDFIAFETSTKPRNWLWGSDLQTMSKLPTEKDGMKQSPPRAVLSKITAVIIEKNSTCDGHDISACSAASMPGMGLRQQQWCARSMPSADLCR